MAEAGTSGKYGEKSTKKPHARKRGKSAPDRTEKHAEGSGKKAGKASKTAEQRGSDAKNCSIYTVCGPFYRENLEILMF